MKMMSLGCAGAATAAAAGAATDTLDACDGLRVALEWGEIPAAAFTGSGLDDATSGGTFKKADNMDIRVEIDLAAGTDTFKWSEDGGSTWEETGVAITGAAQTLGTTGVTVTFAATTGHTLGDYWDIACTATATDKTVAGEGSIPAGLSWNAGIDAATGLVVGNLESDEQVFIWLRRDVAATTSGAGSLLNSLEGQMEAA